MTYRILTTNNRTQLIPAKGRFSHFGNENSLLIRNSSLPRCHSDQLVSSAHLSAASYRVSWHESVENFGDCSPYDRDVVQP